MKDLNIGLIGYGFMGRTHSNAFLHAPKFFDVPYRPVLKAVCARNPDRAKSFAANWGYQSVEADWRDIVARKDIDLIDIASPNDTHRRSRSPRPRPARWSCARNLSAHRVRSEGHGRSRRERRRAEQRLVQLPPCPGGHARQAAHRRGKLGRIFTIARSSSRIGPSPGSPQGGEGLWRLDVNVAAAA
jgi:myo-inositol 2-dehydrogenase/D-chiro-inositol 1-dehydrogenase